MHCKANLHQTKLKLKQLFCKGKDPLSPCTPGIQDPPWEHGKLWHSRNRVVKASSVFLPTWSSALFCRQVTIPLQLQPWPSKPSWASPAELLVQHFPEQFVLWARLEGWAWEDMGGTPWQQGSSCWQLIQGGNGHWSQGNCFMFQSSWRGGGTVWLALSNCCKQPPLHQCTNAATQDLSSHAW